MSLVNRHLPECPITCKDNHLCEAVYPHLHGVLCEKDRGHTGEHINHGDTTVLWSTK